MENEVCVEEVKRGRRSWCGRGHIDPGGADRIGYYLQIPAYQSGAEYFQQDRKRERRYLMRVCGKCQGRMCRGEVTAFLSLIFILLVAFIGGIMESASIQLAKNYRRADTDRAMESVFAEYQKELLEEYDIFALDGSYETGQYGEQNIIDRLTYYGAGSMEHELERIQFLTDRGCLGFCGQISAYMEHKYGLNVMKDMLGMTSVWGQQEEKAESYAREDQACQDRLDELLSEQGGELPDEGNPIAYAGQLKKSPILSLVVPKDRTVSEKRVDCQELLSARERNAGYGEFADVGEETGNLSSLILGEYLLEHFTRFTDNTPDASPDAASPEADGRRPVMYEVEYILAGKGSDRENLESVVKKLLLMRFVPNYTYIQTDSEMRAEAESMALTLCTLLAVPAITEAAAQGILLAWAYGESVMDLRSLLKGNKVPLIKTKESWQLQLPKLFTLGTEEDRSEGRDAENGLDYSEYLRILLFLTKKDTAALRALDIIEQNLRKVHGQTYFRADLCVSRLEMKSVCSLRRGIRYDFKTYYGYR